ncbi:MAG: helix-turn-helix domain-containing protein [Hyphomicrobiaceae bacterium]
MRSSESFIGNRMRELRKTKRMTLAALGKAAGLSVGFLSQVERNLSSPSIKVLHDIARVLGVNISWFFEENDPATTHERRHIVRLAKRRRLHFGSGVVDELLSPNLSGQLELLLSRFEPGAESGGDGPYSHDGEEGGVVLAGSLELWIGDAHYVLEEGDSFGFSSTVPHRYRNPGKTEAVVVWVVTPPTY